MSTTLLVRQAGRTRRAIEVIVSAPGVPTPHRVLPATLPELPDVGTHLRHDPSRNN